MPRPSLGYLYVLSVPYVAALSSISVPGVGGFQYTGFIWAFMLAVGLLLIALNRQPISFPWKLWCPWFGYVFLSLTWGGIRWRYSLQDPAQMIAPLVVGMVASFAIRTEFQLESLMRGFKRCLLFVALVFAAFWYGPGAPYQEFGRGYSVRPAAVTLAFIGCLFVGRMHRSAVGSALGWAACSAIAILSGSRTATLVILVLWLVTPLYRRLTSRMLLSAVMCLAALGLFYSPIFQDRFFQSGHGTITELIHGDFSGSGRFEALWPAVWEAAQEKLVFGAGAGEAGRFAENNGLPDPTPLSGYLDVIFDYGLVGLLILICIVLKQMHVLHKLLRRDSPVTWALAAAYLGFFALLIFAWSEDIWFHGVNFLNPLFAITGAAIGVTVNTNLQAHSVARLHSSVQREFSNGSQVHGSLENARS